MTITKRILSAIRAFRSTDGFEDKWYQVFPTMTKAGTRISADNALTLSGLFAALNFLAGTMATLPKVVYRRLPGGGKEHAVDHPLYDRLHNKPNDYGMTAWQFIYTSIMHKYLWGNWYTLIDRPSYRNVQLLPLLPERMVKYDAQAMEYHYRLQDGRPMIIPREKVLHVPHISLDGVQGKGVVDYARESLGLAKAQDEFAASFFGQGLHPGGFVEIEGAMQEETRKGLQADFNTHYNTPAENWKVIFMTQGATFKPAEIDAAKMEILESRRFAILEVARWVNLPPHILRDLERATFSNIEQQTLELVIYSLLPLATQIEQAMNIAFLDDVERQTYTIKLELKGLLRGDLKARTEFYTAMLDRGVFNADMVLDLEDMNPQPDGLGKAYVLPLNMMSKAAVVAAPLPAALPAPESKSRAVHPRETRSITVRRRLTLAYEPKFRAFAKTLIEQETGAVRAAVKEMFSDRTAGDFKFWLDEYYRGFPEQFQAATMPLVSAYATAVKPLAQDEIASMDDIETRYTDFQRVYVETFAKRHVISSREQLLSVIRQAEAEEMDVREALDKRLDEWEERRPDKIVMRETVRMESAFTRSVFMLCGITKIMSMAFGKSCPYCSSLDGTVIGIEENFLSPGEFQPEGAEKPLIVTSNYKHPPYHGGCDCGITAST